jgi:uroporphyrinogen-III synthase
VSLPLVVIRPEPGFSSSVAQARALGFEVLGEPLSEIQPRPWEAVRPELIDALLIGSANALLQAGPHLAALVGKPVYAVGEATAAAARQAGLIIAAAGSGSLQRVLDAVPSPLRLLRLAGEERVPLTAPPGVEVVTRVVYAAVPLAMSQDFAERIKGGGVVLLHSAASASHFADEVDRLRVPRARVALAALGPRILQAAGKGWRAARSSAQPTEAALLALAADLCHVSGRPEGR